VPGFLLHLGATVQCAHAGTAVPVATSPRVLASGQPIVTQQDGYTVAGCTLPPPPAGNGPCVSAQWVRGAVRVFSLGVPVLLLDSQALCAPTGTPLVIGATQTRVTGM
jgi:hypothetical protein